MKKIITISAVAIAILSGCNTAPIYRAVHENGVKQEQLVVSPNDHRAYKTLKLDNDLEVILVSDPSVQKSAAALSVGVGLLQDPPEQQGMAHYLEHMLFLGTERYPEAEGYQKFMSQHGGADNAYTWLDVTNYMFKINNDSYADALDRFSDFFKSPKLYEEYADKEKNAVNAEWSMRREMDFFGEFKLGRSLMGDHPANHFLIGNLESLGDKEKSKLHQETVNFYNTYYSSNIMKVALVSNQPLAEMEALAKKYFGDIPNKHIKKPKITQLVDMEQAAGKLIHYLPNTDVKQINLDFTIKNNMDDFAYKPNRFVEYLISSEMPGTPAQLLRSKGWISSLSSSASANQYGNYGTLSVNIQLTDEGMKNREEIVKTVMQYIHLIKNQGVNKKYFAEIKTSLNNEFQFLERSDEFNYVSSLSAAMQDYPINHVIDSGYYYQKFDAYKINEVLNQLTPKNLRIWYISKQEPTDSQMHFYDGKYKIESISSTEIESWSKPSKFSLSLPAVNTLLPENFAIKTNKDNMDKPQLVRDKNGIKIWQFPSHDFSNQPKGSLQVYFNNPKAQTDIKAKVLLSIWSDLFNLNQTALITEASIAGMNLSVIPSNGIILNVSGFTDKQPQLLSNALELLQPKFDEQGFDQAIDRYVRNIANQGKQFPVSQSFGKYRQVIQTGQYQSDALIDTAKSLKPEDLTNLITEVLEHNQVRVFAFGNYGAQDISDITNKLENHQANNHQTTAYTRTKMWKPIPGQVVVYQEDLSVADVAVIDLYVNPEPGFKQKARGQILQRHFSTFASAKLRTEEQLAYAVGAFSGTVDDYATLGLYIQTPVKGPKEMQQRFDQFKKEYLVELNKMTPEAFEQLKNSTLISLKEKPKNLEEEVSPFINDWYKENFNFDSRQQLTDEVEKVTLYDVKSFYHETMENPEAARLSVQLRGAKFKDKPYATFKNETLVKDVAKFHNEMHVQ